MWTHSRVLQRRIFNCEGLYSRSKWRLDDGPESLMTERTLQTFTSTNVGNFRGRPIAQAVSHWLPTAAARVRARVRSYGI
jgi:hypothetical protein